MISLTSITGSTDGVTFEEDDTSRLYATVIRASKSKTLDGGVKIDHRGFVSADNDLQIFARVASDIEAKIKALYENETYINLVCKSGFYKGIIAELSAINGEIELTFWPSE